MNSIIIVPIYKPLPGDFEHISFDQCIKILSKHTICIVSFYELDISYYVNRLSEKSIDFKVELFNENYFKDVTGYNKLMLSIDFYKRFLKYEYMLIYQLDAFVFRDELDYWCDKGYDYIGAPLIEDKYGLDNSFIISNANNGGFSLRKISYCIKFLNYKGPLLRPGTIFKIIKKANNNYIKLIISIVLRSCGFHNNVKYFVNKTYINEDLLFCLSFSVSISWVNVLLKKYDTWIKPKLASADVSMDFAFERFPSYLFSKTNKIPFGCHAWEKYEYETFWKNYIHS